MSTEKTADVKDLVVSLEDAAALFDVTSEWLRQLSKAGHFEKVSRGKVRLADVAQGLRAFYTDEARRSSKSAADSRLRDARAREVEQRIAAKDRELVDITEVLNYEALKTGLFIEILNGLPARITRDEQERERIELVIDEERQRLSTRFSEMGADFKAGRDFLPPDEEDDT